MPIITGQESVDANTLTTNRLTGDINEFLGQAAVISLFITSAATGIRTSLTIGAEIAIDDQLVSDANRFPQTPEDFLARGGGVPGDRLTLKLRNTTGLAIITFWRLQVDPL